MDDEEALLTQAALLKAERPDVRIFVYRNIVKALPWYSSVRAKINDPAYRRVGWCCCAAAHFCVVAARRHTSHPLPHLQWVVHRV